MILQITKTFPGYDCMFAPCVHERKGEHGIHGTEIHHGVKTELHDGRLAILVLKLSTDKMPETVPPSWLAGRSDAPRPMTLMLHLQAPGSDKDCPWLGDLGCDVVFDTALGSNDFRIFFGRHGHSEEAFAAALDPVPAFWDKLKGKLAELVADPALIVQADETVLLTGLRTAFDGLELALADANKHRAMAATNLQEAIGRYMAGDPLYRTPK